MLTRRFNAHRKDEHVLPAITDFSTSPRGKWIVILVWLVIAATIVPLAPRLADVIDNDSGTFLPDGAESTKVRELVESRFPAAGTPAILVFHNPNGLADADKDQARILGDWLLSEDAPELVDPSGVISIYTVPQAAAGLISEDNTTMTMAVNILGDTGQQEYLDTVEAIRERVANPPGGLEIEVSGPGGLIADLIKVFETIDVFLTLVTAGLVLVLLVVIYRSPVIAFVPLLAVGWVFTVTGAIGAWSAETFGLPVNGQAQGIMTVLLFGAGTDYCLFIASRFREELVHVEDKHEAMRISMRAVGEAIASSAGTVLIATLLLLLAVLRSTAALGPLLSIAVATMLVASMTLVPAIMTVLGRFAFWPFRPRYDPNAPEHATAYGRGLWPWIARVVADRPKPFLAGALVLFAVMSLGLFRYQVTYDQISALPEGTESRAGFEVLRQSFPAGESAPTEIYVVLPEGQRVHDRLDEIEALSTAVSGYEGVEMVQSASNPFGVGGPVDAAGVAQARTSIPAPVREAIDSGANPPRADAQANSNDPVTQAIGAYAASRGFVSADGNVAEITVVFESNPYGLEAIEEIGPLRTFVRNQAASAGLGDADVLVGGETATSYDTKVANDRDTLLLIPLILLAIGIILGLLLRSVVAPIYLLATVAISYTATLGMSVVLFDWVFGYDGVGSAVALFLFVFLTALGVDYNIYLMARIREETAELGLHDGVRLAVSRTGGVISSAGLILAGTFAALMTLPLRDLFQLGFAVAFGVLIDTFIVRPIVVPAIVLLLGRWNWWPGRRFREDGQSRAALAGKPAPAD
jgi:uncharacterized membrane protein YdfJ with MMPL/SSD domain